VRFERLDESGLQRFETGKQLLDLLVEGRVSLGVALPDLVGNVLMGTLASCFAAIPVRHELPEQPSVLVLRPVELDHEVTQLMNKKADCGVEARCSLLLEQGTASIGGLNEFDGQIPEQGRVRQTPFGRDGAEPGVDVR